MTKDFRYYKTNEMFHGSMMNIMGTRLDIIYFIDNLHEAEKLWEQIKAELSHLDSLMNRFDKESDLSRINQNAYHQTIIPHKELWSILYDCQIFHEKTKGFFDITLKDMSKLILSKKEQSISFISPDIKVDLGAYAKGYALKKIRQQIKNIDIKHCFINFGDSSIMGIGHHPYGDSWKVSIENPFKRGEIVGELVLKDSTISTSGNTPFYTNHLVNPYTGKTNHEKELICIQSKDPVEAEVLSTALMVASQKDRANILSNFDVEDIKILKLT